MRLRQATGVSNECSCGLTGLVPDEDRAWTICVVLSWWFGGYRGGTGAFYDDRAFTSLARRSRNKVPILRVWVQHAHRAVAGQVSRCSVDRGRSGIGPRGGVREARHR